MASKIHRPQHPSSETRSRSPDIHGARTLASFLAQQAAPTHRESVNPRDQASRRNGAPHELRNTPQAQSHDYKRERPRVRDTGRHTSPYQHNGHTAQSPIQPRQTHQRHPSLSLDTRNLAHTHASPFPLPRSALESPSFSPSEPPSPLHTDLTSLKAGLESLWSLSSHKLHVLHRLLATQDDNLRALTVAKSRLEASLTQQKASLSQDAERLRAENFRVIKDGQEAEEARRKALREREMLGVANARLWEDKARLEGEKRELRVKLDAEAAFAKLCKEEAMRAKKSPSEKGVRIKREEDEGEEDGEGEGEGISIPLKDVKILIEERMKSQADEFTQEAKELYEKLANTQTRVTELEAQLKRYSGTPGPSSTSGLFQISPPAPPRATLSHHHPADGNGHGNVARNPADRTPPIFSPVTPYTGLPSSNSETEREFPFVRISGGRKVPGSAFSSGSGQKQEGRRHAHPAVPRDQYEQQRVVSGPMDSDRVAEREMQQQRRMSAPTPRTNGRAWSVSHSTSPIMDALPSGEESPPELGGSETVRDVHGQVVSTYGGVGAGWKPASVSRERSSRSQAKAPQSRPTSPIDRPPKRARTADSDEPKREREREGEDRDIEMASVSQEPDVPAAPPEAQLQEDEDEPGARDMTSDERLMFSSLSSVLTKKRDGDGWKCVLCRQEKRSPTATFSESTPIGVVTQHVKDSHRQFWRNLKEGDARPAVPEGS